MSSAKKLNFESFGDFRRIGPLNKKEGIMEKYPMSAESMSQ